jgi:plastocyanin
LRFDRAALEARAGAVTIAMSNPSQLSHSIAIEGNGISGAGQVVTHGGTSTVSSSLKPGTYTFFCTVPGHREAGMRGTLTVK